MVAMFKAQIKASEAVSPYNTYDSILEIPGGTDPNQNAWLTLQLRVKLNFADSKNPVPGLIVNQGGKFFAKDTDGYLFPLLDWPAHLIARFQREFVQVAERTWNWQFVLITPKGFSDLDFPSKVGDLTIRPNVLCLFRLSLLGPAGPVDNTPAAGPLRSGAPHRTINIVNLSLSTRQVKLDPSVTPTATKPAIRNIPVVDGLAWRSNANNYDDSDLFNPTWENKEHKVLSNTVGHEIGHALGQCHIMGLKGIAAYTFTGANANDAAAYGTGSPDPLDAWNIMGRGSRLYLINAVSWKERIALHTKTLSRDWDVTGIMTTPTRKMAAALTGTGLAPAQW
jgi:hypothetical protein